MEIKLIQKERIQKLNDKTIKNRDYVLYWMQSSQRAHYNHALEYSIIKANKLKKPLLVYFGLTNKFPDANRRHYYFMLEGLKDVKSSLKERNIELIILRESPEKGAIELSKNACLIIVDAGYLKIERGWRKSVASSINCPLIQVESNVVVPVETASSKEEYAAFTIRKKINKIVNKFLLPLKENLPDLNTPNYDFECFEIEEIKKAVKLLDIDENVKESNYYHGGTYEALKHLKKFLNKKIERYEEFKNDPNKDSLSNMSPYLHYGQISPLYIALEVSNSESPGKNAYLEELIIRRELSMNFVFYNSHYDSFDCLPNWAKNTLLEHKKDRRNNIYSLNELENAETADPYWNASQKEMVVTGKMHGYMRMYWGKKIIEWIQDPKEAFEIGIHLNNKYEIDGRDPNGYTGIAWCFGKHDRAWKEREIFGKVRYMNSNGLRRKFDVDRYVKKVNNLKP